MAVDYRYESSNFYMLRNPSFPIECYQNSIQDTNDLKMKESILVASKSLYESLDNIENISNKTRTSYIKYQIRSTTRPTPFGLFSGVSLGTFGDRTDITLKDVSYHKKRIRVDMEWLRELIKNIQNDENVIPFLWIKFNEQSYEKGDRLFNSYMALNGEHGKNDICSSVRYTNPVKSVQSICAEYRKFNYVAEIIMKENLNTDQKKVEKFLIDLIKSEILLTNLRPPLINTDPFLYLLNILKEIDSAQKYVSQMKEIREKIERYNNTKLGDGIDIYINMVSIMKKLAESNHYLQVDFNINAVENTLSNKIAKQAEKVAGVLTRLAPNSYEASELSSYKTDFVEAYGYDAEVPILQMLDEDIGIGSPVGYQNPPSRRSRNVGEVCSKIKKLRSLIQNKLLTCEDQIVLTDADIENIMKEEKEFTYYQVHRSIELYLEVIASSFPDIDNGDFLLHLSGCRFSVGAGKSFGRFSDLIMQDTCFHDELFVNDSEQRENNEIIAEIHEFPTKSRSSNVTLNRNPYEYQIALSTNICEEKTNIPITDIYIGLDDETDLFYAKSRSLNKRIQIKSSHMLTTFNGSNAYRFLREIAIDGRANIGNVIAELELEGFNHLPRILYDKTILRPAQWRVRQEDLDSLIPEEFHKWKEEHRIPPLVYYLVGDNRLLMDMDNVFHVHLLLEYLKKTKEILLTESIHELKALIVKDIEDQKYVNEIVVPLYLRKEHKKQLNKVIPEKLITKTNPLQCYLQPEERVLFPGEENWLYMKIYGYNNRAEEFLGEELVERVQLWKQEKMIEKHFFIRYSDPEIHFRVRFKKAEDITYETFLYEIYMWSMKLKQRGLASKIVFDTYERELIRYGGKRAIIFAESFFDADSYVVELLMQAKRNKFEMNDDRIGLRGFLSLAQGFGLTIYDIHNWLGYNSSENEYRELCKKNKESFLRTMMLEEVECDQEEEQLLELFNLRNHALKEYIRTIEALDEEGHLTTSKESVLKTLLHMFSNRFSGNNTWERKIYHILRYSAHAYIGYKKHRRGS